jgi:hypothetical protein
LFCIAIFFLIAIPNEAAGAIFVPLTFGLLALASLFVSIFLPRRFRNRCRKQMEWILACELRKGPPERSCKTLPPTGLTVLLYHTDGSAESVLGVLDRYGCLSAHALTNLSAFKSSLEAVIADDLAKRRSQGAGWAGPTAADSLARALLDSPYLGDQGRALAGGISSESRSAVTHYWRVAYLSLALPTNYKLVASSSQQKLPLPGPVGRFGSEESRSWADSDRGVIHLSIWQPSAPRPGGPMMTESRWTERVAGRELVVNETSLFMGRSRRVLVTHFNFQSPIAQGLLYAEGLNRGEFGAVLKEIELRDNEIASK